MYVDVDVGQGNVSIPGTMGKVIYILLIPHTYLHYVVDLIDVLVYLPLVHQNHCLNDYLRLRTD